MPASVIVIGLGCAGSAACAHLTDRGADVVGLERFELGHARGGSSHQSRAFRLAYAEHPGYVPLLRRARELWLVLNERWPETIFHPTGGLYLSRADGGIFAGFLLLAAVCYGIYADPHAGFLSGRDP